jgi:hypothetical protein
MGLAARLLIDNSRYLKGLRLKSMPFSSVPFACLGWD